MKNAVTRLLLASVFPLAFSAPAFADSKETYQTETKIEKDANGNYSEKDTTVKNDASGKTTAEKKIDVSTDKKGDVAKTVETKQVHKQGWFDKDTVKTKDTEKTKDGQVTVTHEKDVNGKTVESTTATTPQAK